MASTSDFRNGLVLRIDGNLFSISEFQHVKMGRGAAFVRSKLKNLQTGRVVEKTFRSGEKVKDVRLERRNMQYLYREGENLVCMDNETYEQLSIPIEMLTSGTTFLREGDPVDILMDGINPIGVEIQTFVVLEVVEADPSFKGDTVSNATKKVVLESGGYVQAPMFVNVGDKVKIDTRTSEYIERVK
jgi:elongation factor P